MTQRITFTIRDGAIVATGPDGDEFVAPAGFPMMIDVDGAWDLSSEGVWGASPGWIEQANNQRAQ